MPQIALVSDQHDDDVRIGMISELLQPPGHVLVGLMLADVVHKQSAHCSPVVGRCDGSIAFLTSRVPDLCFDRFGVYLYGPGGKFNADGGLGVQVEFIASETAQQVGLSNTRVSNEHH